MMMMTAIISFTHPQARACCSRKSPQEGSQGRRRATASPPFPCPSESPTPQGICICIYIYAYTHTFIHTWTDSIIKHNLFLQLATSKPGFVKTVWLCEVAGCSQWSLSNGSSHRGIVPLSET